MRGRPAWVTAFASQPSVSMEKETTQCTDSPRRPALPSVFMTSRRISLSEMSSPRSWPPERATFSHRKRSISSDTSVRKLSSRAPPDSSYSLSIRSVRGVGSESPMSPTNFLVAVVRAARLRSTRSRSWPPPLGKRMAECGRMGDGQYFRSRAVSGITPQLDSGSLRH
jgi:hypothetical protein